MLWNERRSPSLNSLGRAVQRAVVVGVVVFAGGEHLGEPVDRRRRRGDDLAHVRVRRRFDDVERAVDEHLEPEARVFGDLRDADGGLVEHARRCRP